jgi:hypothetical protein
MRVLENRVLRRIFGPKRDEVSGGWRKLHGYELCTLYPSPIIITMLNLRRTKLAAHVARMQEKRNAYRLFVGKPEERRPLRIRRRKWMVNIKMDFVRYLGGF